MAGQVSRGWRPELRGCQCVGGVPVTVRALPLPRSQEVARPPPGLLPRPAPGWLAAFVKPSQSACQVHIKSMYVTHCQRCSVQ